MKSIISSESLSKSRIRSLLKTAQTLNAGQQPAFFNGDVILLFYEPSTRTRTSFALAAQRLGLGVVQTENAGEHSSAAKGETLEDTIRTLASYKPKAIVLRHPESGAAARAQAVTEVPVVNAGDGGGEHPTQVLVDLFTMQHFLGSFENKTVAVGGDLLHGRATRSFIKTMARFGASFQLISPSGLQIDMELRQFLDRHKTKYDETDDMAALQHSEVVYWSRIQQERGSKGEPLVIDRHIADTYIHPKAILMSPLPRIGEISPELHDETDPRMVFFRQAGFGVPVRMAIFAEILKAS